MTQAADKNSPKNGVSEAGQPVESGQNFVTQVLLTTCVQPGFCLNFQPMLNYLLLILRA